MTQHKSTPKLEGKQHLYMIDIHNNKNSARYILI